jgi:hypothetical protein
MNMLTEALNNASPFILDEAGDILGCDPIDAPAFAAEAAPAQRIALELLVGMDDDGPGAVEMLDLADDTMGRVSMGRIASSRLARWEASLGVCPLPRGSSPAAGSLNLPALDGDLPGDRRGLNRSIRALSRVVWGAAFLRHPELAVTTRRTYGLGDLAPVFADVLRAGHDDIHLTRRARQLADALAAFDALGRAHKSTDLAADLGIAR